MTSLRTSAWKASSSAEVEHPSFVREVVGSIPIGESDFLLSYAHAMFEDFMLDYWMRFIKYTKVIR